MKISHGSYIKISCQVHCFQMLQKQKITLQKNGQFYSLFLSQRRLIEGLIFAKRRTKRGSGGARSQKVGCSKVFSY